MKKLEFEERKIRDWDRRKVERTKIESDGFDGLSWNELVFKAKKEGKGIEEASFKNLTFN